MFYCRVLIFFLIIISSCTAISAQVNNNGNLYIAGNVFVNSSFTNTSTASYQNNGDLYLAGDFVNDQPAMTEGTGITRFINTSLQHISGSQSPVFHDAIFK